MLDMRTGPLTLIIRNGLAPLFLYILPTSSFSQADPKVPTTASTCSLRARLTAAIAPSKVLLAADSVDIHESTPGRGFRV
eukprot:scaffold7099_cov281-Pinguiococcus_pyrenoidosus.AAC.34